MNAFGFEISRADAPLFRRPRYAVRAVVVGGVAVAVVGAGIAYAAWSQSASGSGAAKSATVAFTVQTTSTTSGSAITNLLRPGSVAGTASGDTVGGDLKITLNNTSGFPVHVTQVVAIGAVTSDKAGCTAATSGVQVGAAGTYTVPVATLTVAGDSANHDVVIPNALSMTTGSDTTCQGATFTIPVTVTVST
jgi:hypothetical protein